VTVTSATGAFSSDGGARLGSAIFVQLGSSVTPLGARSRQPQRSLPAPAPPAAATARPSAPASSFPARPAPSPSSPGRGSPRRFPRSSPTRPARAAAEGMREPIASPRPTECRCCHKHVFGVTTINPGTLPVAADANLGNSSGKAHLQRWHVRYQRQQSAPSRRERVHGTTLGLNSFNQTIGCSRMRAA
jgi:hypothetical protein